MAAIASISNGEAMSSVRTKLNSVITEINLLDPTDWVDYSATSTVVGWSVLTTKIIRYRVIGKQVFVSVNLHGTSNNTATTFTLPFQNKNIEILTMAFAGNNGSAVIGAFDMIANSSTCTCYQNFSPVWTASGTKYIYGQFFYEIA
jgi:hypothetical protein